MALFLLEHGRENPDASADDDAHKVKKKVQRLQKILGHKLAEFLDSHVMYTLRRVLARHLYVGPQSAGNSEKSWLCLQGVLCISNNVNLKLPVVVSVYLCLRTVSTEAGEVCEALGGLLKAGGESHPIKGGVRVTDYLTYNWWDFNIYLWLGQ